MIEAVPRGKKCDVVTHMPLADGHCGVALILEEFGNGAFLWTDANFAERAKHAGQRNALGVAASQYLCTRRGADGRCVKTRELHPFARHAVEVGRAVDLGTKRADIAVAQIVSQYDDEVGMVRLIRFCQLPRCACGQRDRDQECHQCGGLKRR